MADASTLRLAPSAPPACSHPCAMVRPPYTQPRATAHQPQLNQAERAEREEERKGNEM